MRKEIKIILVKFFIITGFLIIFTVFVVTYFASSVFGQFDQGQNNQFGQQGQSQFGSSNNQFGQQGQFGNDQFGSNQFGQNQFGGTPSYNQQYPQSYGMYGGQPQYNNNNGFGIQQIVAMIVSAGAGAGGGKYAADRRTKSLEELHRETMEAELKSKEQIKELARVTYQLNADKANVINDAPAVKLDNLSQDVDQFREKVAKA